MKYASRSIDGSNSRNRETECKNVDEMRNRKMDFGKINFGVDGDSITAGNQWSWHVFNELGFASHHNVAVGSSVWYKRTVEGGGTSVTTGLRQPGFCRDQRRLAAYRGSRRDAEESK